MTRISAKLRGVIFSGAVGLLPSVAFADDGGNEAETTGTVPDHAAAEARGQGDLTLSSEEMSASAPDHARAEARGQGETTRSGEEMSASAPDHAAAERRGGEGE
jgi:hypothetical protein